MPPPPPSPAAAAHWRVSLAATVFFAILAAGAGCPVNTTMISYFSCGSETPACKCPPNYFDTSSVVTCVYGNTSSVWIGCHSASCECPSLLPSASIYPPNFCNSTNAIANGTVVTIRCNTGYSAVGSLTRPCINGTLMPSSGACLANCSAAPPALNSAVAESSPSCTANATHGSVCLYDCINGTTPDPEPLNATCNDGTWTPNNGACVVACDMDGLWRLLSGRNISNAICNNPLLPLGSTCSLSCPSGWTALLPESQMLAHCTSNKTFALSSDGVACVSFISAFTRAVTFSFSSPSLPNQSLPLANGTRMTVQMWIPDYFVSANVSLTCQYRINENFPRFGVSALRYSESLPPPGALGECVFDVMLLHGVLGPATLILQILSPWAPAGRDIALVNVSAVPRPVALTSCPASVTVAQKTDININGQDFVNTPALLCVLNHTLPYSAVFTSPTSITCKDVIFPQTNDTQAKCNLTVSNAGDFDVPTSSSNPVTIGNDGNCDQTRKDSISYDNLCRCPPGWAGDNKYLCTPCPSGFYKADYNDTACIRCNTHSDTFNAIKSTADSQCMCSAGFFSFNGSNLNCAACVDGAICPGKNSLAVKPGFWNERYNTVPVVRCFGGTTSCAGSSFLESEDPDNITGDFLTQDYLTAQCAIGYQGPLCAACIDGYASPSPYLCTPCGDRNANIALSVFVVTVTLAGLFIFIDVVRPSTREIVATAATTSSSLFDVHIDILFKVMLNYLQGLYYLGQITVGWTESVSQFWQVVSPSSIVSVNSQFHDCAIKWSFYEKLTFFYFLPFTIAFILLCYYAIRSLFVSQFFSTVAMEFQSGLIISLYLIHPTLMLVLVSSIRCFHVGNAAYLYADAMERCYEGEYWIYASVSAVYIIFYIFGLLIYLLVVLRLNAANLHFPHNPMRIKYGFLLSGLRKEAYYFEIAIMTRKLLFAAVTILPEPVLQLAYAALILFFAFALQNYRHPYRDDVVNVLENISLILLFVTVMVGFHSVQSKSTSADSITFSVVIILFNGGYAVFLLSLCLRYFLLRISHLHRLYFPLVFAGIRKNNNNNKSNNLNDISSIRSVEMEQTLLG